MLKSKNKTQKVFEKTNSQKKLINKTQSKTNNNYSNINNISKFLEDTSRGNEKKLILNPKNFDYKESILEPILNKIDSTYFSIKNNVNNNSNSNSNKNRRELILEKRNLDKILEKKQKDSIAIEKQKKKFWNLKKKIRQKQKKKVKTHLKSFFMERQATVYKAPNHPLILD